MAQIGLHCTSVPHGRRACFMTASPHARLGHSRGLRATHALRRCDLGGCETMPCCAGYEEDTDAALGGRWGGADRCGAAGCLRDHRTATAGHPSAAARAPGPPIALVAVVRPRAGTLAQRRAPRDLLEFLWPIGALPADRGVGRRVA